MPNKRYSVKFTPIAMNDLEEIYIYIATQLYNEPSASGIIDKTYTEHNNFHGLAPFIGWQDF